MKGQKGVTLTSLTVYIIVSAILLGTLAFININFMSELSELTKSSKYTNETTKFYSYFIKDVKTAKRVLTFSENTIKFDNGIQYEIRYRSNKEDDENQTYNIYEVYRNNILITDKLSGVFLDYNTEEEYINVRLYVEDDDIIKEDEQYFKIGRGY